MEGQKEGRSGHWSLHLVPIPPSILVIPHSPSPKPTSHLCGSRYICGSPVPAGPWAAAIPHTWSYYVLCLVRPCSHLLYIHPSFNSFLIGLWNAPALSPAVLNSTFYGLPGEMLKGHPYLKKKKKKGPETSQ